MNKKLKKSTLKIYQRELNNFNRNCLKLFGEQLSLNSVDEINEYFQRCYPDVIQSQVSLRVHRAALGYWFRRNTGKRINLDLVRHKSSDARPQTITADEFAAICSGFKCEVSRLVVELVFYTGNNLERICQIRVKDLLDEEGLIKIKDRKRGGSRLVQFPPHLRYKLAQQTNYKNSDDYLFTLSRCNDNSYRPIPQRTIQKHFTTALQKSGLGGITISTIRHSFIIRLIEQGYAPEHIQRQVGYKTRQAIERHKNRVRIKYLPLYGSPEASGMT